MLILSPNPCCATCMWPAKKAIRTSSLVQDISIGPIAENGKTQGATVPFGGVNNFDPFGSVQKWDVTRFLSPC